MRRSYVSVLTLYLIALGFGVFTPRPDLVGTGGTPIGTPIGTPSIGGFPSIGHQILYLGGFWAWVGNFLMLVPLVYLMHLIWPKLGLQAIFINCLLLTITIEFIQLYIPGRVSDLRDVVHNGTGAGLALLHLHWRKASKNRAQK